MPRQLSHLACSVATLVLGVSISVSSSAADVGVEIAEIGIGGYAKVGHWAPVRVKVKGIGSLEGRIEVVAPDSDGVDVVYGMDADAASVADERQFLVYVKLGREGAKIRARFVTEEATLGSAQRTLGKSTSILAATQKMILRCGASIGVEDTIRRTRQSHLGVELVEISDLSTLPDDWIGFSGVDRLIVVGSDVPSLLAIAPKQAEAIVRWVEFGGGKLTVVAGAGANALFSDPRFESLAPGEFREIATQSRAANLENFAHATKRLSDFEVSLYRNTRGRVVVSEPSPSGESRPIITRYPAGFGMVTFVAVDLHRPPFADWSNRSDLVAELTPSATSRSGRNEGQNAGQVTHIGYEDLSGQLRNALDRFHSTDGGVRLVSFSPVAAAIVLYILLIGPGDYFFLRRFVGKMEFTWFTFPLMVALFSGAAVYAFHRFKGDQVRVNQVDLLDVDTTSSIIRGSTWLNVYSPRTEAFTLDLKTAFDFPRQSPPRGLLSWQGLPGVGLGGLRTSASATFFDDPYRIETAGHATIRDMPIQVSSTKSLTGNWWSSAPPAPDTESRPSTLRVRRDFLRGELTNPFPVELTNCVLVHENWAYLLDGRLAPGGTVSIAEFKEPKDLEWRLTRRRVVQKDFTYVATPWLPDSNDIPRIMEMLLFHDAAGGQSYTLLSNRYLNSLDLSSHLKHHRAILFGQADAAAGEILRDGKPLNATGRRWTFCRAIFEVSKKQED